MAAMLSNLIIMLSCLLLLNTLTFMSLASPDLLFLKYYCIDHNGNYTANSTYQANLNTLLSNLTSDTSIDYGFYNFSQGQDSDKVNAIGMCRGDVKPEPCRGCLKEASVLLTQLCPNQKEAIGWKNKCMLRYSCRSIFGAIEHKPRFYKNTRNRKEDYKNVDNFNELLSEFLGSLRRRAASGDSHLKFADDSLSGLLVFKNIFAHAQCTPDLSKYQCDECLIGAISDVGNFCFGRIQCEIGKPSCYLKYDTHSYFHYTFDVPPSQPPTSPPPPPPPPPPPLPPPTPPTPPPPSIKDTSKEGTVIAIAVPVVSFGVLVLLTSICIYLGTKKLRKYFESNSVAEDEIKPNEILQFDLHTIIVATNNFSEANKVGQGGFGLVYKGTLPNGDEVAIKRLSKNSGQGEIEFKNELLLVAKLQHRNLVRLLGFCLETGERLLVYEFLPNKSLDCFIFDPIKRAHLDWESRYKIVKGVARGLLYLHEDSGLRIIHRDLKASNILLDKDMNPKIADFGMARLFPAGQSLGNTHRIVGTYGYMAPEYALHGHISVKTDVFSFGVLLLEIVSGFKNGDIRDEEYVEHLISFAWRNWRDGTTSNIIDPTMNDSSRNEIMRCIHIGLLCVQENVVDRPTMASVVVMFNSCSLNLPIPSQPAYFLHTRGLSKNWSAVYYSIKTRSSE